MLVGASVVTQSHDMVAKSKLGIIEGDARLMRGHPSFDRELYNRKEQIRKESQLKWFLQAQRGEVASGMTVGEVNLAILIPAGGKETQEGIDAVLTGMVTGLWTAFEVLVEQTWNGVVKERPQLKSSMTNKERKQSGFRSLHRVRHLYGYTFRVNEADIFKVLNDDRIDALALTRNILVHTDGVIDEEFDERRKLIPALNCFTQVSRGDKIHLTGNIVCNFLEPIIALGFELVQCIGSWLASNP